VRVGVRLAIYEKSKNHEPVERRASGIDADTAAAGVSALQVFSGRGETPAAPPTLTYGTRLVMVAKLHPACNYRNPGAFDYEGYLRAETASVCWGRRRRKIFGNFRDFSGAGLNSGGRAFIRALCENSSVVARVAGIADGCDGSGRGVISAQLDAH
jgi:hypothetical protein